MGICWQPPQTRSVKGGSGRGLLEINYWETQRFSFPGQAYVASNFILKAPAGALESPWGFPPRHQTHQTWPPWSLTSHSARQGRRPPPFCPISLFLPGTLGAEQPQEGMSWGWGQLWADSLSFHLEHPALAVSQVGVLCVPRPPRGSRTADPL